MQAVASLCMFVVGVVTFVVGVRLMALGLRNHQVPELAFGTAFLSGSLGTVGAQLGQRLWWTGADEFATSMNAICFAIQVVGTFALFLSTWRIYRPGDSWAFMLAAVGSSFAVLAWVLRFMHGDFVVNALETPGIAVFHAARISVFGWAATESLLYHDKLKKRLALGLADPVVTQQIYMWGVSAVAAAGVSLTIVASVFVLGRHPLEVPEALATLVLLSLVLSACMWCAFFPPEALKRWATNRTL